MASNLNLVNLELLQNIAMVAGINRDPTLWSDQTKTDVRLCIRRGLAKFYQPQPLPNSTIHQWRFLERKFYASYQAPYTTGVVGISGGTATISGGTWPSWKLDAILRTGNQSLFVVAAPTTPTLTLANTAYDNSAVTFDGTLIKFTNASGNSNTLVVAGSTGYTVGESDVGRYVSITSGSNLTVGVYQITSINTSTNAWTLSNANIAYAATGAVDGGVALMGDAVSLHKWRVPLPADFAEFLGNVTYSGGLFNTCLRNVSDEEIRLRYTANFTEGNTSMYSIQHGSSVDGLVGTTGEDAHKWYMSFWPTFSVDAAIIGLFRSSPLDNLDDDDITEPTEDETVHIDAVHSSTMLAAILSCVDEAYNDRYDGVYHQLFITRLAASIAHDRHAQAAQDFAARYPGLDNRAMSLLGHVPYYYGTDANTGEEYLL